MNQRTFCGRLASVCERQKRLAGDVIASCAKPKRMNFNTKGKLGLPNLGYYPLHRALSSGARTSRITPKTTQRKVSYRISILQNDEIANLTKMLFISFIPEIPG